MFYRRFKLFALIITGSLLINLASLAGCAASAFTPPRFEEPLSLPPEITVDQLYSEYSADEAAADAKYNGEKLLLYEVVVEEVKIKAYIIDSEVGIFNVGIIEFESGGVGFTVYDATKWNIETGFILNIEGICLGISLMEKIPTIQVSYIESIKGDIGGGGSGPVEGNY
jgi:hypothetical protein